MRWTKGSRERRDSSREASSTWAWSSAGVSEPEGVDGPPPGSVADKGAWDWAVGGAVVGLVVGPDFGFFVEGLAEGFDLLVSPGVFRLTEEPLGEVFILEAIRRYQGG